MTHTALLRVALAAALSIGLTPAFAQEEQKPAQEAAPPAGSVDLDAAPTEGKPDPLTPKDNDQPLIAPGAKPLQAEVPPAQEQPSPLNSAVLAKLGESPKGANKDDIAGLNEFYTETKGAPLWIDNNGLTDKARAVMAEIAKADDYGLDASAFQLPSSDGDKSPEALASAEIKLSHAVLKYARFARGGRIDLSQATPVIDYKPPIYEPKSVLAAIAAAPDADGYLRGLHPKHPQFEKLRQQLIALRSGDGAPAVSRIPAGPNLRPGDDNQIVALVRKRLNVEAKAGPETLYDEALVSAVRSFQKSHGLEPSGIIDAKLRAALNEGTGSSPQELKQKLLVNMERWRWMPEDLGQFYVWNSIPEQLTRVFDNGKMTLMERIVVGKPSTPTPSFSAKMQFVIFHPEWGVPDSIKANEIGPKLRRASSAPFYRRDGGGFLFFDEPIFEPRSGGGSEVLNRMGLRVSQNGRPVDPDSIDWNAVDPRRFDFIQSSGPRNVLGVVKFRFPNKHDVYMHDTPDKNLFGENVRAYSHGCMRTQNPVHLAEVLLGHDRGWSPEQVRAMAGEGRGSPNEITLSNPIPVHVTYFTAEVGDDGKLKTHSDLYGLDAKVLAALNGQPLIFKANPGSAEDGSYADAGSDRRRSRRDDNRDRDYYGDGRDPYRAGRDRYRGDREPFRPFGGLFE